MENNVITGLPDADTYILSSFAKLKWRLSANGLGGEPLHPVNPVHPVKIPLYGPPSRPIE